MWMCITEITLLYTVTTLIINCTPMQNKVKKKKIPQASWHGQKENKSNRQTTPYLPRKLPWLVCG